MQGVAESTLFKDHIKRHAPRLNSSKDLQGLIFETAIRVFCNIHLDEDALINYPDETRDAAIQLRDMGLWIKDNMHRDGFMEKYGHIIERYQKVARDMNLLLEQEELLALKSKSQAHRYPWEILYNDLRRYLLKCPL